MGGIVMPAGDKNLHSIYINEKPCLNEVRVIAKKMFLAVHFLHQNNIMHGDLKPLHFVRSASEDGSKLMLIDLVASERLNGQSYKGKKFSSAFLPPELFYEIDPHCISIDKFIEIEQIDPHCISIDKFIKQRGLRVNITELNQKVYLVFMQNK